MIILPAFIAPLVLGQRFPVLMDLCGPLIFLVQMTNLILWWMNLDSKEQALDSGTGPQETWSKDLLFSTDVYITLLYLINDCFLVCETFYSRTVNFTGYVVAMSVLFWLQARESASEKFLANVAQTTFMVATSSLIPYLVQRRSLDQFVVNYQIE